MDVYTTLRMQTTRIRNLEPAVAGDEPLRKAEAAAGGASGPIATSGLTMATGKILGRTTAAAGPIEEITVGSGLTLAAGVLSATGGAGGGGFSYGATAPATPTAGDRWVDANSGIEYTYISDGNSSQWVEL
ncbi:MAG: hypothetical protein AzoDbin1_04130 [Azoarcus sp.]|nr:hypothetical protein [Azoarcus sp.]